MQSAKVSMVVSIHNLSNSILFVLFVCLFIIGLNNALRFVALINRFILLSIEYRHHIIITLDAISGNISGFVSI